MRNDKEESFLSLKITWQCFAKIKNTSELLLHEIQEKKEELEKNKNEWKIIDKIVEETKLLYIIFDNIIP